MSERHPPTNEDDLFDSVVSTYDSQIAAGEDVDRDELIAANPQIKDRLCYYFSSMDVLGQAPPAPQHPSDVHSPDSANESTVTEMSIQATVDEPVDWQIRDSIYEVGPSQVAASHPSEFSADAKPPSGKPIQPTSSASDGDGFVGSNFGRYQIERLLGHGMMGTVYLAKDSNLGRDVALKIPKASEVGRPEFIERFYREARSAATLDHPNICQIHDVGEIDGTHYISMMYVDGKPLSELVDANAKSSQRKVATLIRKVALAMDEAHGKGIVHRDLKPDNIMVDRRHEPIVMDFGLARIVNSVEDGRLTQQGQLVGTPAYMSPEQVDGDVDLIGPRTDIYALGAILFELLTGRLPFEGRLTQLLRMIATEPPPKLTGIRKDVNEDLEAVCLRMLKKSIDDRYASMAEVALELGSLLKGRRPPSVAGSSKKSARSKADDSTTRRRKKRRKKGRRPEEEPLEQDSGWEVKDGDSEVSTTSTPDFDIDDIQLMTMEAVQIQVDALIADDDLKAAVQQLNAVSKLSGTAFEEYVTWAAAKLNVIGPLLVQQEQKERAAAEAELDGSPFQRAAEFLDNHDYRRAYEEISKLPKGQRSAEAAKLRREARHKMLAVQELSEQLATAIRESNVTEDSRLVAEELLELVPKHGLAAKVIQDLDNSASIFDDDDDDETADDKAGQSRIVRMFKKFGKR